MSVTFVKGTAKDGGKWNYTTSDERYRARWSPRETTGAKRSLAQRGKREPAGEWRIVDLKNKVATNIQLSPGVYLMSPRLVAEGATLEAAFRAFERATGEPAELARAPKRR